MFDAVHHMKIGKCENSRTRRSDDYQDYEISDFTTEPVTIKREWSTVGAFSDKLEMPDGFDFDEALDR